MPSVRGRERHTVAGLLVAAATLTGGLIGLISAVGFAPLGQLSKVAVLTILAAGIALDGAQLAFGWPSPPTSNRQVPQEWSRLFDPRIVAILYGARLGVGPLTILSTWTWWSVTIAAAASGPVTGVTVGACFGFVRLAVTVAASVLSERSTKRPMASEPQRQNTTWFAKLRARQRSNWIAITGVGAAAVLTMALAGCSPPTDTRAQSAPATTKGEGADAAKPSVPARSSTTIDTTTSTTLQVSTLPVTVNEAVAVTTITTPAHSGSQLAEADSDDGLETLVTVQLEDVVRTELIADDQQQQQKSKLSSEPAALAQALLNAIEGFSPVDDPNADRYLDLDAASNIQPDPTEEVALLETRGFEGGWTRAFRNENNDVAVASVYQFEDAAEAEFYLEDGLITIGGYGGKFFDLEDQPGVRGFVQYFSETDETGTEELVSLGASFQTGPRWHLVYFVGSTETITPDLLIPTVAAQRQLASKS